MAKIKGLPDHLGGHMGITHVDKGILKYFKTKGCKTYLDIGCGPGGMTKRYRWDMMCKE